MTRPNLDRIFAGISRLPAAAMVSNPILQDFEAVLLHVRDLEVFCRMLAEAVLADCLREHPRLQPCPHLRCQRAGALEALLQ